MVSAVRIAFGIGIAGSVLAQFILPVLLVR